ITNRLLVAAFTAGRQRDTNERNQGNINSQNELFCFHPSIESGIPFPVKIFPTTNGHHSTRIQTSFDSVLQNKMKEADQIQTVQDLCSLCCLLLKQSSCLFVCIRG